MTGKKRKRPLHHTKHTFFDKRNQQPKENVSSDDSQSNSVNVLNSTGESTTTSYNNEEELLAIRVIGSRTYFLIQNGSSIPKWQPISSAPSHASKFISYLSTKFDALQLQQEIDSLRRQHLRKPPPDPWQFCVGRKIHEVRFEPKCEPQYLLTMTIHT